MKGKRGRQTFLTRMVRAWSKVEAVRRKKGKEKRHFPERNELNLVNGPHTVNFNPDSRRGVGVTPHKMEDRALHCEALRIRALGGREGPGPQSTGFSSLTIQMRKQRPKEVK